MKNLFLLGIATLLTFTGCSERKNENQNDDEMAVLSVRLTDAPADYDAVWIDLQEVLIHVSTTIDEGEWISLENVNTGIYNLLDYTHGIDTVLVEQEIEAINISQMRLVLGENNGLTKNGVYHEMKTPSAQQSGLKFNIHANLVGGIMYNIWIDFDAGRSIVEKGNGGFSLKPVIRTYTEASSGIIKGIVEPVNTKPYIMAISENNDTLGSYADTLSGSFFFGGVQEGIYKLEFLPVEGYQNLVIKNIGVTNGVIADLGIITLVED